MNYKVYSGKPTCLVYNVRFWFLTLLLVLIYSSVLLAQNTVYINPLNSGDPAQDGTIDHPYDSWTDVAWTDNTTYLQLRGTTSQGGFTVGTKNNIKIGAYGTGEKPIITGIDGTDAAIVSFERSTFCSIENVKLTGHYPSPPVAGVKITGHWSSGGTEDIEVTNVEIEWCYNGIRIYPGNMANCYTKKVTIDSVHIHHITEDGIFIIRTDSITVRNTHIEYVNLDFFFEGMNQIVAGGDCIQLYEDCDDFLIENCILDRRYTGLKFCLIHNNGDTDYKNDGIVRGCTFYSPKDTIGSESAGGALYMYMGDSLRIEHCKFIGSERTYSNDIGIGGEIGFDYMTIAYCVFDSVINLVSNMRNDILDVRNCTFTGNNDGSTMLYLAGGQTTLTNCAVAAGPNTTPYYGIYAFDSTKVYQGSLNNWASEFGWVDWENGNYRLDVNSVLKNKGCDFSGYLYDLDSTLVPQQGCRDVGPYEYTEGGQSNNLPPEIDDQYFDMDEDVTNGYLVGNVAATDPNPEQSLVYSILSGNQDDVFDINTNSGALSVVDASTVDFESISSYTLTIMVMDDDASPLTDAADITINVNDINEPPQLSDISFSVDENSATGTFVGQVVGVDPDNGQTLSYEITGGDAMGAFTINVSTGEISVDDPLHLNFEQTAFFLLTIEVTDNGTGNLSDQATVTVNVNDVNEPPQLSDISFSVDENSATGTFVGQVVGVDPDNGQTLSYEITGGDAMGVFSINNSTGEISVDNPLHLNFEQTAFFLLTIEVTDNGTGNLSDQATVTVNVNDVNEPPVAGNETFSLNENSAAGTIVGVVSAIDPDIGQTLSYQIVSGNTSNTFEINDLTGEISVYDPALLDFESTQVFSLVVEVTDNGASILSDMANVTINILDVNEQPNLQDEIFNLSENSLAGTLVGVLSASDPDMGQNLTYSILSGNANNAFSMDAVSGEITVLDQTMIDYESNPVFDLMVEVTDDGTGNLSDQAQVLIYLTDINEPPVMANQSFDIDENSPNGTVIGVVAASDPDMNQQLTFSIIAGNSFNAFNIDQNNGVITISNNTLINFEEHSIFNLIVEVEDDGPGNLSAQANVDINVLDVNEPPVINTPILSVNINSDDIINDIPNNKIMVGIIDAVDPDNGQSVTYEFESGNERQIWELDPNTGELALVDARQLAPLELNNYTFVLKVTDNGPNPISVTENFLLKVNIYTEGGNPSVEIEEELIAGMNEVSSKQPEFGFYPNPASDRVIFEMANLTKDVRVHVFDMQGQKVKEQNIKYMGREMRSEMYVNGLDPGIYIISFQHGEVSDNARLIKH